MAKHVKHEYENNPFFIGLNGIKLLFAKAQSVAIFAIVLCVLGFVGNTVANIVDLTTNYSTNDSKYSHDLRTIDGTPAPVEATPDTNPFASVDPSIIVIIVVAVVLVLLVVLLFSLWLYGTLEYTGAQLALDKEVHLKDALLVSAKRLGSYLWLNVLVFIKIFLWSLLLIVPGFIMAIRYSLSGTVFFAENKKSSAAIKRSLELTKGAWFTTFAAYGLWNLITFSQVTALLQPGTSAVLYRQLRDVTDANKSKPDAHWLSWLTFFVPIAFFVIIVGFIALAVILAISLNGVR